MAYISYKDVPLYFGLPNSATLPTEGSNTGVIADSVQLNYTPNISPQRIVGKTPTADNFVLAGPPNSTLSFSAYIDATEFDPTDFTGDIGNTGATFRLGDSVNGISGSGAFLTSYSFTLTPYQPVLVQCDFAIYNPLTISSVGGKIASAGNDNVLPTLDFGSYGHGAYSTVGDTALSDIGTVESVQYQYSIGRLPIYEIGSYYPSVVEVLTEEHTLTVQGDNVQALVPITGANPGAITIDVKNSSASNVFEQISINGRLNAENITIQGGDLARGSVTITELLV